MSASGTNPASSNVTRLAVARPDAAPAARAETATVAVDCQSITKTFGAGAVRALDGVSLAIRSNEFFTLLGPSGCGKTTLLRLIAGFEIQDAGTILLDGRPLDGLPPYRRPVNTVFQSYAVFPHLNVAENVAFGLEMKRRPRAEIDARVKEMLGLVKLEGLESRKPAQLSGGQQQRVALARALANKPRVLLLDEPLSALDLKLRTEMQLELKRLQHEVGITFVFVTHDQHEALTMSDRIAVMRAGHILQVGTPEEIYEHPSARFVADFIGETNLLDATRIGTARFRLASGVELETAEPGPPHSNVTLVIRPERALLAPIGGSALPARVEQVVYIGSDTIYLVVLEGGLRFRIREQNRDGPRSRARAGDAVGIVLPPAAIRVLAQ
ncbi:MAG TPA: ABC transporter ATP-binding protein [Stellaceae bacterium]|nr:ABC transporter ATP-binding protein [Stellaceae bacterium]